MMIQFLKNDELVIDSSQSKAVVSPAVVGFSDTFSMQETALLSAEVDID